MREGFVTVPGGTVFHRTVGEGAPGIPLLVLHGGPGIPHDHLEQPEAYLTVVSDFVQRVEGGQAGAQG